MTKKIDVTLSERELFISAVDGIVQSSCARQIIIKERTEKEEKKNFVCTFAYLNCAYMRTNAPGFFHRLSSVHTYAT